ncbi:aldehyde dehydrogenase [Microtetraspora malaysiensis]|uniref:aldehyde dehydrogenase n=1 Tax=Microtetraspora malaysiensis TaxID=161358 RepID=UPI003D8EA2CC
MSRTDHDKLYIGGRWVAPLGGQTLTVRSAATEEIIGSVPAASEADVDAAVVAARAAFTDPIGWRAWEPERRAAVLERFADEIDKRTESIITAISRQNGMPITVARKLEAGFSALLLRYYAKLIREQPAEDVRPGMLVKETSVRRHPVGVVAAIVPWNVPQTLTFTKVAPAMAAGCAIVVKPSPETVLDAYLMAEAARAAGVPDGVLSIVPGGRELGAYLVSHPGVDKVAFTGSTEGGRAVAEACARLLRPVSLELGGKSAAIFLDDADLDAAGIGESLFAATLVNNGQVCFLGTRVLAPRSRYAEVIGLLEAVMKAAPVGDPLDEQTLIGPMASARQRDRVLAYIDAGRAEGARVIVGGGRASGPGWFVQPTLFADVDNSSRIAQEEIFGPVLSVIPYDSDDDAVRIANDSAYGLGGTVWSSDSDRAVSVASRVQTGTIGINGYAPEPTAPFGGVKASGIGREFGPEGLASYQNFQSIYFPAGRG